MQPNIREMQLTNSTTNHSDEMSLQEFDPLSEDFFEQILSSLPPPSWDDLTAALGGGQNSSQSDGGVSPVPTSFQNGLNLEVDDSVQAMYNMLNGTLQGGQESNQAQHHYLPQVHSFGTPAANSSTGGAGVQRKQKVRARRGQATDPHSIAERLRRERISEKMKCLQELVPNANKTDKASMLDEIIDYVKFLQLQVKRRSTSEEQTITSSALMNNHNNDNMKITESQVAKLMEEDMGSAMKYLQGKGLSLMPISLATAITSARGSSSPNMSDLTVQSTCPANGNNKAPI